MTSDAQSSAGPTPLAGLTVPLLASASGSRSVAETPASVRAHADVRDRQGDRPSRRAGRLACWPLAGVSDTAVARAWPEYGIQPWRVATFKVSTDPELVAKVTDIYAAHRHPAVRTWLAVPRR